MMAGFAAYHCGAGIIGALFVGFVAGEITLVAGQIACAVVRSPALRGVIALLFAAPATLAGYHVVLGLAQICVPSAVWREIFAVAGAIFVGGTAFVRVAAMTSPPAARQVWATNFLGRTDGRNQTR